MNYTNHKQDDLYQHVMRMYTVGGMLFDHVGKKQQKVIHEMEQLFTLVGAQCPTFETYISLCEDLENKGFPSEECLAQGGKKFATKEFNKTYKPFADTLKSAILSYISETQTKH